MSKKITYIFKYKKHLAKARNMGGKDPIPKRNIELIKEEKADKWGCLPQDIKVTRVLED